MYTVYKVKENWPTEGVTGPPHVKAMRKQTYASKGGVCGRAFNSEKTPVIVPLASMVTLYLGEEPSGSTSATICWSRIVANTW